jgi:hypothetical protein
VPRARLPPRRHECHTIVEGVVRRNAMEGGALTPTGTAPSPEASAGQSAGRWPGAVGVASRPGSGGAKVSVTGSISIYRVDARYRAGSQSAEKAVTRSKRRKRTVLPL